jgi:prepilin-type processing-associated H-X9-DG protein/prepilin-type N-terminal cleavage/methylation domain-containing protein
MLRRPSVRRGVTLLELLVVLAIIVCVMLVLWPVASRPHHPAYRMACQSNLKQVGTALFMYLQDYDDHMPPYAQGSMASPTTLPALLHPYLKNGGVWRCPRERQKGLDYDGTPGDASVTTGYNWLALSPLGTGVKLKEVLQPVDTVGFVDAGSYLAVPSPLAGGWGGSAPSDRHGDRVNALFLDGHVKATLKSTLEAAPTQEGGVPLGVGIDGYRYWNLK